MTHFSFKVYNDLNEVIFNGCEVYLASKFEMLGYNVKRFWKNEEIS